MRNLRAREMFNLVIFNTPEPEKHLEKMLDWERDRYSISGVWFLGLATALIAGYVAAAFKKEPAGFWQWMLIMLAIILSLAVGMFRVWRLRIAPLCLSAAISLFNLLRKHTALLRYLFPRGNP